ncbi:MAG: PDZ domain-containing protein [Caldilineaceae bacterium SB0661_bin_32]|uniref:PDZ domain-containing protein n=1 Tax=Caldilineaceae bacterium SB0661_bin_32 TaxID=2605255 RepID=A0A6B1DA98_9CHLR|nr:PDZ domain-containing protein [Caldilineaceae bacterium SB0661_bin_32]
MRQPRLTTSESTSQRAANRRIWLLLSVTLLALTALGGTASAQSMTERVKPEPGVLIVAVGEETPASEAGLMRGDILLAIDGDMVNTAAELQHVILMQDPGDMLELTVKRGGEELTLTVTLADVDGYPLLGVAPDSPGIRGMRTRRGRFPAMRNFVRLPALERFKGMDGNAVNVGEGAVVMEVIEDSPAATAGLMAGDLITSVGETEITGMRDLAGAAAAFSPGDDVELTVDRDGETVELNVTLGAHPDDGEKAFFGLRIGSAERFRINADGTDLDRRRQRGNRFGFAFPQGGRFDSRFFFGDLPDGALVMGVQDEGPAALAELQRGDVITAVGETNVANFEELVEALADFSPGDEVSITLNRDGETVAATVTLGAHPDDEDKAYLGVSIMPLEHLRMHMKQMQEQHDEERQSGREPQSSS